MCSAPPRRRRRQVDLRSRAAAQYDLSRRLAAAGEVEQALRSADRALSLYELDEDNRALSEAHLAYAQRLLDVGDAEAGRHLIAARNLLGAHPSATDHGRILVEDARQALLVGDAAAAAQRAAQAVRSRGRRSPRRDLCSPRPDELGEVERADAAYIAAIEAIRPRESRARGVPLVRQFERSAAPRRLLRRPSRRRPRAVEPGCAGAGRDAPSTTA
jgi:hypothetical protein